MGMRKMLMRARELSIRSPMSDIEDMEAFYRQAARAERALCLIGTSRDRIAYLHTLSVPIIAKLRDTLSTHPNYTPAVHGVALCDVLAVLRGEHGTI